LLLALLSGGPALRGQVATKILFRPLAENSG